MKPGEFNDYLNKYLHGAAPRTHNRHHETLRAFLNWCVSQGWLASSPLASLKMLKVGQAGRRRRRRAYTTTEFRNLLAVAPEPRRTIYIVAATSGLRRSELNRLEIQDVSLTDKLWTLRPTITKNRKRERLPMTPECFNALAPYVRTLMSQGSNARAAIFPTHVPHVTLLYQDMKSAGIERKDGLGRVLDFHSFRYFFCTQMSKFLPIQKVMKLMRHSTITLTANLYNDLDLTDNAENNWTLASMQLDMPQQGVPSLVGGEPSSGTCSQI